MFLYAAIIHGLLHDYTLEGKFIFLQTGQRYVSDKMFFGALSARTVGAYDISEYEGPISSMRNIVKVLRPHRRLFNDGVDSMSRWEARQGLVVAPIG
jgi:hypothetical protein